MGEPIISIKDLYHAFGDVKAVDGISFDVEEGQVFSLLGPNGAGKSTTINVLITLLPLQKGQVIVAGKDVATQQQDVRRSIGVVFQEETLDSELTVWESMEFLGRIYSMPKDERRARIDELIDLVDLDEKRDEFVKNLSGGMKRRLEIARGLLVRPKVLFLDEPTLGLDPQGRKRIWESIEKVRAEGVTIFLTTHYMDEADQLSDVIDIIDQGRIIATGTPEELKRSLGRDVIYVETTDDERAAKVIEGMTAVSEVKSSTKGLAASLDQEGSRLVAGLVEALRGEGIEVTNLNLKRPTLDDVFIYYTGRGLREEEEQRPKSAMEMMMGGGS